MLPTSRRREQSLWCVHTVGEVQAIVAGVPFVDCLTTMLDDSIPLTTIEYEEWGNPHERQFYDCMKSYAPVDNVQRQVCTPCGRPARCRSCCMRHAFPAWVLLRAPAGKDLSAA